MARARPTYLRHPKKLISTSTVLANSKTLAIGIKLGPVSLCGGGGGKKFVGKSGLGMKAPLARKGELLHEFDFPPSPEKKETLPVVIIEPASSSGDYTGETHRSGGGGGGGRIDRAKSLPNIVIGEKNPEGLFCLTMNPNGSARVFSPSPTLTRFPSLDPIEGESTEPLSATSSISNLSLSASIGITHLAVGVTTERGEKERGEKEPMWTHMESDPAGSSPPPARKTRTPFSTGSIPNSSSTALRRVPSLTQVVSNLGRIGRDDGVCTSRSIGFRTEPEKEHTLTRRPSKILRSLSLGGHSSPLVGELKRSSHHLNPLEPLSHSSTPRVLGGEGNNFYRIKSIKKNNENSRAGGMETCAEKALGRKRAWMKEEEIDHQLFENQILRERKNGRNKFQKIERLNEGKKSFEVGLERDTEEGEGECPELSFGNEDSFVSSIESNSSFNLEIGTAQVRERIQIELEVEGEDNKQVGLGENNFFLAGSEEEREVAELLLGLGAMV